MRRIIHVGRGFTFVASAVWLVLSVLGAGGCRCNDGRVAAENRVAKVAGAPNGEASMKLDRNDLAQRIEGQDEHIARILRDKRTSVKRYDTPFLQGAAIYEAIYKLPTKPVGFAIGATDAGQAVIIGGDPKKFNSLVQSAGIDLSTDEQRRSYALVFLESTRNFGRHFQIISSIEELELVPNASEEERSRFEAIVTEYSRVVVPLKITREGEDWFALAFAMRNRQLVRLKLKFTEAQPEIQVEEAVLEEELPVPVRW